MVKTATMIPMENRPTINTPPVVNMASGDQRVGGSRAADDPTANPGGEDRPPSHGCRSDPPEDGAREGAAERPPLDTVGGPEGGNQRRRRRKRRRKTRSRLKIASLNMRGYGPVIQEIAVSEKWLLINQLVRDNHIAVLALQETHLTEERIEALNRVFASSLTVLGSPDPANQTGARGVAFVLNRSRVGDLEFDHDELIPGRAMELRLHWKNNAPLTIHNVYAPNAPNENQEFWESLTSRLSERNVHKPDIVLGDFNTVEDALDRLPMHDDDPNTTQALRNLKAEANLIDGWRRENPTERDFTFLQTGTGSQSRIDRIYVRRDTATKAGDWIISEPGLPTDHSLVSMTIANYRTPFLGEGRWAMPTSLTKDTVFTKQVCALGRKLLDSLGQCLERTATRNPQTMYKAFKEEIRELARARAKAKIPKLERRIKRLKQDHSDTLKNPKINEDANLQRHAALLKHRIATLEVQRFSNKRVKVAARDWLEGETTSKYWMKTNAPPKPDEVIYELQDGENGDESRTYINRSDKMAELARDYFDSLQEEESGDAFEAEKEDATVEALRDTNARISNEDKQTLESSISDDEIRTALREAPTGKSPGLDGIPAKLWKACHNQQLKDEKNKNPTFNVVAMFRHIFNDIEDHGTAPSCNFAQGWICPIYKKNDRRRISNYRPITLLNADYKILTRVLASRLATVAPTLIHGDQTGFVPGRKIFDNIRLTKTVVDYAEREEINGMIIALDQEKAYDRINHDYLWRVMGHAGFPEKFINTIKTLYSDAESVVILNGEISSAFRITRGVRQGDPMSCLLFNLAIEPLACMLRKSELIGIEIPGLRDRLIATLFADDTTVYLSDNDDLVTLQGILTRWCKASRAKFNAGKTEVIPIGSKTYRESVINTRKTTASSQPLPDGARVVPDGIAVRMLGAWVGNGTDPVAPWTPILDRIKQNLKRWGGKGPTMDAKKLIVGFEVGSRTQFLARAQGMPKQVEKALESIVGNFLWDGGRPMINKETLYRPRAEGGLNLLDLQARNEAIELIWAKEYLALGQSRPRWAYLADTLLARAIASQFRHVCMDVRINTFLQTWEVSPRKSSGIPEDLAAMIRTAKRYQVRVESPNPTQHLKETMPVWYSWGATEGRQKINTETGRCLTERHNVLTVRECIAVASRITDDEEHSRTATCGCRDCEQDRNARSCENPARCAAMAARLVDRLHPIWNPNTVWENDGLSPAKPRRAANPSQASGRIPFNPSIEDYSTLGECVRVFTGPPGELRNAVRRPPKPFEAPQDEVEIFIAGSQAESTGESTRGGCGIWFGPDERNRAIRSPTKQVGPRSEMYAVMAAVGLAPPFAPLHIVSRSRLVVRGLTSNLESWENNGWIGVKNADLMQTMIAKLRARSALTTLRLVEDDERCEDGPAQAEALANEGMYRDLDPVVTALAVKANRDFLRRGAQLSAMTQRLLYAGIRTAKMASEERRKMTELNVERVLEDVNESLKVELTRDALWLDLRDKEIGRRPRQFLWRGLHRALRIGEYWEKILTMGVRANCPTCGVTESL